MQEARVTEAGRQQQQAQAASHQAAFNPAIASAPHHKDGCALHGALKVLPIGC
jgi:hypothetical protein